MICCNTITVGTVSVRICFCPHLLLSGQGLKKNPRNKLSASVIVWVQEKVKAVKLDPGSNN